jgi:hypothetical protein
VSEDLPYTPEELVGRVERAFARATRRQRRYDSTIARIAGNILSGDPELMGSSAELRHKHVVLAVALARDIVAEVERTEPEV